MQLLDSTIPINIKLQTQDLLKPGVNKKNPIELWGSDGISAGVQPCLCVPLCGTAQTSWGKINAGAEVCDFCSWMHFLVFRLSSAFYQAGPDEENMEMIEWWIFAMFIKK